MKRSRYVLFVFSTKTNRGAGLMSVFADSRANAIRCGMLVIGRRPFRVTGAWSYRKYAARVRVMAIDNFIHQNTKKW